MRLDRPAAAIRCRRDDGPASGHRIHGLDVVVAMWDVSRAREAAWTNGRTLWGLRALRDLAADFLAALDRIVCLVSRGLLLPPDSLLRRVARIV